MMSNTSITCTCLYCRNVSFRFSLGGLVTETNTSAFIRSPCHNLDITRGITHDVLYVYVLCILHLCTFNYDTHVKSFINVCII